MKKLILGMLVLGLFLSLAEVTTAQTNTIPYEGRLTAASGARLGQDTATISFSIYDAVSGGTLLWGPETHDAVSLDNGVFNAQLGIFVALPPALFDGSDRYLEIQVRGEVLTPRQSISSVPYAIQAAGWVNSPNVVRLATGSDRVGIGISAPRGKLDVASGRLHFDGSSDYGIVWGTYGGGATMLAHIHRWSVDNRLYVTNNGGGNLTGVYLPSGGTAWVSTSDRRLKENVREAPYGLNTVLQLPVHEYNLKGSSEKKIGFIAQEIYPILPEIVSKGDDGEYTPPSSPFNIESAGSTPVSSPWGVDYAGLTPVLVKAIQEQQRQIEELKEQISKLTVGLQKVSDQK